MKIVTPFRPFPIESKTHRKLGPFDWIGAIEMLRHSAKVSNNLNVTIITDVDTDLPEPCYKYVTKERQLMLWILEVSLKYLKSSDFNEDTVFISPDYLIFGRLDRWWGDYDIGLLWRGDKRKFRNNRGKEILNSVQFWRFRAKHRLIDFYENVLKISHTFGHKETVWGADTISIEMALAPLFAGKLNRGGLIAQMLPIDDVVEYPPMPPKHLGTWRPNKLVDFKYIRKLEMRAYFEIMFAPPDANTGGWSFPNGDRFMIEQFQEQNFTYQLKHLKHALKQCKQFRTAIDGGAHIGTWSVPMGKEFKQVHSFEPALDTFLSLKDNVQKFGTPNITIHHQALGNTFKRVKSTLDGGDERHIRTGNFGARRIQPGNEADMITIDSLDITDLDFLKLDVEGSEYVALMGAVKTLNRCKPIVLFENKMLWTRYYGLPKKAPHNLLASLGAVLIEKVSMDEIWGWPV